MKKLSAALVAIAIAVTAFAGEYKEVSVKEAREMVDAKKAVFIDVNGTDSYKKGRIPGALNFEEVKGKLASTLPKDVWNLRGEGPPGQPSWRTQQDYANQMAANRMPYPDKGIFLPATIMFDPITDNKAQPWTADALAKIAPTRFTAGASAYKGNTLWFRPVGAQPGASTEVLHDLVGNVAEYVFDGPKAIDVVKSNTPTVAEIDAAVTAGKKNLFVIGGSSLSPPQVPFNVKQPLDPGLASTAVGFCDVGFRLAYTAPIDSIFDVLTDTFSSPKYLPGPKAKK